MVVGVIGWILISSGGNSWRFWCDEEGSFIMING